MDDETLNRVADVVATMRAAISAYDRFTPRVGFKGSPDALYKTRIMDLKSGELRADQLFRELQARNKSFRKVEKI